MIRKIHYFSGLTISVFVALHLCNHVWSIAGAEQHIELMNTLRLLYRNPLVEILLLTAVFVQILSGINLWRRTRKTMTKDFEKLHIYTGLYLAFFLFIHVSAVLGGRFYLKLDTNFYFGVAGLNTFPTNLFFIPYYSFAILAFFGHVASIHSKKMKRSLLGLTPRQQSIFILIVGFFLTILILYGLTNKFNGVIIPPAYKVLTGK